METVYIGVVGGEQIPSESVKSIWGIATRPADSPPFYISATKGFEARQSHLNNFMASKHDYILLLDHDMLFPQNTLERLLSHNLPYVSGFYMRRSFDPIVPIWFENAGPGVMPYRWFSHQIEPDKLYEIGASGWGCMLMHRSVIEKAREYLKGEPEIIEDDMDVYPYDLARIMNVLSWDWSRPAVALEAQAALRQEIRPNRVVKDHVGSDVRFPFYAKLAGVQLYGDSGVQCGHFLNYPLSATDWMAFGDDYRAKVGAAVNEAYQKEVDKLAAAKAALS